MKKILKCIAALIATTVAFSTCASLASCGGSGNGNALVLFVNNGDKFDGVSKDRIWTKLEEKAGVELKFNGTAHSSSYYTKLNPLLNTMTNTPDVVFVVPSSEEMGLSTFSERWTAEGSGLLYNYDALLAEYPAGTFPYLERVFNSNQYKNIKHNGGHYILPNISSRNSWGIYYRTDWLINIGYYTEQNGVKTARYPQTLDEITDVMRKFAKNDPDQNGKADTYGFCPGKGEHSWNPFYHAFGVSTDWDLNDNGDLEYMYTAPEFKEFLGWANGLYKEGVIYPTFSSIAANGDRELFYSGKTGILITNAESHVSFIMSKLRALGLAEKVGIGPVFKGSETLGENGSGGFSDWGGWWGGFCITKTCKNVKAALTLLDYLYSTEGCMLRTYGIENVHYTVGQDGEIIPNNSERLSEGGGKWEEFTVDNVSAPVGRYVLGTVFGYPVDWEHFDATGEITLNITAKLLDAENEEMVQRALDLVELKTSKLCNITAYSTSAISVMNGVQDKSKAFINNAIIGKKNLTSDWDDLIRELKGLKWTTMEKAVKKTLRENGIIQD